MTGREQFERRRAARIRKVVISAMGRFVFFPWMLCGGLSMLGILVIMRRLYPHLDPNGWPFILRAFPIWIVLLWLTLYVIWAVQVRLVLRRKGVSRTVRYLFPEALSRTESRVDRFSYWALGIRPLIQQARQNTETGNQKNHHAT